MSVYRTIGPLVSEFFATYTMHIENTHLKKDMDKSRIKSILAVTCQYLQSKIKMSLEFAILKVI